ncbi:hypothetical protein LTR78_010753 [Recurvomyces mirabilis]|uniref:Uncharacterized protein n=1 Tax=Recurvomyces mirabilis TaxID=574656 RepID=A0AAE0WHU5_9PEZI|nr:hypothetical protein LTR78_010753 [Recurvomyces mirabilis]KAK5155590.1 hypothetical protein LTS14_005851 [Recurvomyces mirabilis]
MEDAKPHPQEAAPAYSPDDETKPMPEKTTSQLVEFVRCAPTGFVNRDRKSLEEGKHLRTRSDAITIADSTTYDQLIDKLMERGPDLDGYSKGTECMRSSLLLLGKKQEVRISDQESWAAGREISGMAKGKDVRMRLLYALVPNDYTGKEKKCAVM